MSDIPWPARPPYPAPPFTSDQSLQVSALAQQYVGDVDAFEAAKKFAPRSDADTVLELAAVLLRAGHAPAGVIADAQAVFQQWRAAYPPSTPAPT